ncbi:MAG: rhodanese-like domain-containing protein [Candidatus Velthaea sp.]
MFFKQYYLGCLAHASYLIGSKGDAVVVDPQRDVDVYIAEAAAANLRIRYIFETHVHADFVSGHNELAERTGATIVVGWRAAALFSHHPARDGEVFKVGALDFRVLETPGHTPEGISIVVYDRTDPEAAVKVLTGDTLFIGDVGRPDLVGSKGYTSEQMAEMLYHSLHDKLMRLDDAVEVFPAHGAGSLCGRNISKETSSTIGAQRRDNHALAPMTKEEFVALTTRALPEQPAYFAIDADLNRRGVPALELTQRPVAMTPVEVERAGADGALLLDVRPSEVYGPAHIFGSMNVGLDGQFASWAGTLIPFDRRVIILTEDDAQVDETVMRLARIGFTSVVGYLAGGISAWKAAHLSVASTKQISVAELDEILGREPTTRLIDVRRPGEFDSGAAPGAVPMPLAELEQHMERLDPAQLLYVVCGSGYRSSIATSMLESAGFSKLVNVEGGMGAYNAAGYRTVVPATV